MSAFSSNQQSIGDARERASHISDAIAWAELQTQYLDQIGEFTRLTPEEELTYAKQFHEARAEVQKCLQMIPSVIIEQLRHFDTVKNELRISNYIELDNNEEDGDIRKELSDILRRIDNAAWHGKGRDDEHPEAVWKLLSRFVLRDSFYDSCLKKIADGEFREKHVSGDVWHGMEARLMEACRRRDEARRILVEHNLRLVIAIARNYERYNMSLQDLVQEGNMGLMRAVEKFDYRLGRRLSTYASFWIRQSITRALTNYSRTIRISANTLKTINDIRQAERDILIAEGTVATAAQIAERLDISQARVRALQKMAQQPVSLQAVLAEDAELADIIPDESVPNPESRAARLTLRTSIGKALNNLDEKERIVVTKRFGLDDEQPMTLQQIAELLGLSSERVRQLEAMAIQKLRKPESLQYFDGYGG